MTNYSHSPLGGSVEKIVSNLKEKHPHRIEMIDQLAGFGLGRFLLERGGLNGFWIHHIITYPEHKVCQEGFEKELLTQVPYVLATQQRYQIFKRVIQEKLCENAVFASIPCGLMGELLTLDYSQHKQFKLVGIDIDPESLELAAQLATESGVEAQFHAHDAWYLPYDQEFDLLTSNGLNIYIEEQQKVIALYREFHKALKVGGSLVTSFLTPPVCWKMERINSAALQLQEQIFSGLLEAKFQNFITEKEIESQLESVGFKDVHFHYDEAHIYPTVVARRG